MFKRLIPVLLIENTSLVKTSNFKSPIYLGDPVNALKIFNDKEVDEILIIDKSASRNGINFGLLQSLSKQAFMPLGYVGGIRSVSDAEKILRIGFEKIALNTSALSVPNLAEDLVKKFGSQSIAAVVDFKKDLWGKYQIYIQNGSKRVEHPFMKYLKLLSEKGFGEYWLQSISNEGCFKGYDLDFLHQARKILEEPIVVLGGARNFEDFKMAIHNGADAVAAGSTFVFYNNDKKSILINYPKNFQLENM
jgi:cyclase